MEPHSNEHFHLKRRHCFKDKRMSFKAAVDRMDLAGFCIGRKKADIAVSSLSRYNINSL